MCFIRIIGYADGATDPIDFPIAPKFATEKLLAQTGVKADEVGMLIFQKTF